MLWKVLIEEYFQRRMLDVPESFPSICGRETYSCPDRYWFCITVQRNDVRLIILRWDKRYLVTCFGKVTDLDLRWCRCERQNFFNMIFFCRSHVHHRIDFIKLRETLRLITCVVGWHIKQHQAELINMLMEDIFFQYLISSHSTALTMIPLTSYALVKLQCTS